MDAASGGADARLARYNLSRRRVNRARLVGDVAESRLSDAAPGSTELSLLAPRNARASFQMAVRTAIW
jgi:hypothetical protein